MEGLIHDVIIYLQLLVRVLMRYERLDFLRKSRLKLQQENLWSQFWQEIIYNTFAPYYQIEKKSVVLL